VALPISSRFSKYPEELGLSRLRQGADGSGDHPFEGLSAVTSMLEKLFG
jgi:hypothetical protein